MIPVLLRMDRNRIDAEQRGDGDEASSIEQATNRLVVALLRLELPR